MNILVLGAAGFLGGHLCKRLRADGHRVIGVDRKRPEFEKSHADVLNLIDLRTIEENHYLFGDVEEVYQLAAEVGGMGYLMDHANDAVILRNSSLINLRVLEACRQSEVKRVFFASSACVYPTLNESMTEFCNDKGEPLLSHAACRESDAYPYHPEAPGANEYAFEKLFAERLYDAYARNYGLIVRIGRFHNVFGTHCTWTGGREKFPAALCRKVAETPHGKSIELWGNGSQQRSFTYVDDAVEGMIRLMRSDFQGPVNIGSSRMVTVDEVARQVIAMSNKWIDIKYIDGPIGVRGRNSDNTLILEKLGWEPKYPLESGLLATYQWVQARVTLARHNPLTVGTPAV